MKKDFLKEIKKHFNIVQQCRRNGLSLWQCPQFLFLIMGALIIAVITIIYFVGGYYLIEPEIIITILSIATVVLFVISFVITQSFERMAEVSRMKTDFINIISHQIRTPLTSLRWMHDLLSDDKDNLRKDQIETLQTMHASIKKMIRIASDLLIASRMEGDKLVLRRAPYSLEEAVRRAIKESEVSASLKIESDLPTLKGDEFYIRSAVVNLLDNAAKYGGGKVDIEVARKNGRVVINIRDNGAGIAESDRAQLFQKFFKSGKAIKYSNQGIGLGLFVVRSIIETEGGSIDFKSEKGKGTEFWISLPI